MQRDGDAVDLRRAGLAQRTGLRRPAGAEVGVIHQHVKRGRLDLHDIGDGADRGGGFQHPANAVRGLGIDKEPAIRVDLRVQRLALKDKAPQPVIVARPQIGAERLLVRRVKVNGGGQRRAPLGKTGSRRFAIQHGQSLFLLLQLRCHLVLKALELAQKTGKRGLNLLGRSAGHAFPGPSFRLGRLHTHHLVSGVASKGAASAPPTPAAPRRTAPPVRAGPWPPGCRPWPRPAPREASGR